MATNAYMVADLDSAESSGTDRSTYYGRCRPRGSFPLLHLVWDILASGECNDTVRATANMIRLASCGLDTSVA